MATDRYRKCYDGDGVGPVDGPVVGPGEDIVYSSTDWTPATHVPRAVNAKVAGLVKCDIWDPRTNAAGQVGVTLWFVQGTNAYRVCKVYNSGTTAGLGLTAVGA